MSDKLQSAYHRRNVVVLQYTAGPGALVGTHWVSFGSEAAAKRACAALSGAYGERLERVLSTLRSMGGKG